MKVTCAYSVGSIPGALKLQLKAGKDMRTGNGLVTSHSTMKPLFVMEIYELR